MIRNPKLWRDSRLHNWNGYIDVWFIISEMGKNTREIMAIGERVARIVEHVEARLRRQYGDIDRDVQESKAMMGGGGNP